MHTPTRMQQQIGRRIHRLHPSTHAETPETPTAIQRRLDALRKEEAATGGAGGEPASGTEQTAGPLDRRVNVAKLSAAADSRTFVAAIAAELRSWDAYLEGLQVKAATSAASARGQAEASISELRRHRNALAQRLGELRSPSAQAETEARKAVEVARDQLQRAAAQLAATAQRGLTP